ncbi:MAG: BON domain-containing protein [Deltaproteobacteria bacterium]|nr:BON domain-containing protein [Deltaproteobacteria bacterium]
MKTNKKWMVCFIIALFISGSHPARATSEQGERKVEAPTALPLEGATRAPMIDTAMDPVALIRQHLQLDSRIHATDVQINRKDDSLILFGSVMNLAEKQLLEEIIERTWGKNYSTKELKVNPSSVPDYEIQRNIATAIPAHCQIEIRDLGIEVRDGNVTLKGTTNALHHRIMAAYVAANTKGVKSVTNNIHVIGKRASDQLLAENIRSLLDSYLKDSDIQLRVAVNNGKVTLGGEVSSYDQTRYIRQTAENVPGVVSVEDKMTRKTEIRVGLGKY